MKFAATFTIILLFISVMFYSGCKDTITGDQIDNIVIPSSNVSYSKYIQPVLNLKCATAGCHDDISKKHGISFTTWSNTTADPNVIFPGKPQSSSIIYAVKGLAPYEVMPPISSGLKPMNENQANGLETWIKEDAKNN